jgi:hypothetical protein
LPIPASPPTSTVADDPAIVACKATISRRSSSVRPTNHGQDIRDAIDHLPGRGALPPPSATNLSGSRARGDVNIPPAATPQPISTGIWVQFCTEISVESGVSV